MEGSIGDRLSDCGDIQFIKKLFCKHFYKLTGKHFHSEKQKNH